MPGYQSTPQRAGILDSVEAWMKQRNADVQRLGSEAEAAGRAAWAQATRTGQNISAVRPSDVAAIGAHVLNQNKQSVSSAGHNAKHAESAKSEAAPWQNAIDQFLAGAHGAQDSLPFDLGDRAEAGTRALIDAAHGEDLGRAYDSRRATGRARDQYDAAHYGVARTVGQVVGTGAQLAALGPAEAFLLKGARIAEAAPLIAREVGMIGSVGGTIGVGEQVAGDMLQHRQSSLGDYAGAALGGAVGALASKRGSGTEAGAAAGAVTAVTQDLLNGRRPSFEHAREGLTAGAVFGGLGGIAGRVESNALSNAAKEKLGEDLSRIRTWARGDETLPLPKSRAYLDDGRYTYPDQRTLHGALVESKFGLKADLSPRQRQAFNQPLKGYRVDPGLPSDIGVALGFPTALTAYQFKGPNDFPRYR